MHILNAVYGDSTGGRWNATLKTGELLAQRGHRVTLLVAPEDGGALGIATGTDLLADFDQPGVDLARHAKALFRFVARPDFGGIALDVCRVGRGHAGGAYRTGFFLGGRLVAAAREGGSQQAAQTDSGQGNGHG